MTSKELKKTWKRLPWYRKMLWFGGKNIWKFIAAIATCLLLIGGTILNVWVAYTVSVVCIGLVLCVLLAGGCEDADKLFHEVMSKQEYQLGPEDLEEMRLEQQRLAAIEAKKAEIKAGAAAIKNKYPWLKEKRPKQKPVYPGTWTIS